MNRLRGEIDVYSSTSEGLEFEEHDMSVHYQSESRHTPGHCEWIRPIVLFFHIRGLFLFLSLRTSFSLWRHCLNLSSTVQSRHPCNPLRRKQFCTRFCVVDDIDVVQNSSFDNPHTIKPAKGIAVAEQRGPAVWTEIARDGLARVGNLGDLLWLARKDFELRRWHHEVVAVVSSADLAAVGAVAQSLEKWEEWSVIFEQIDVTAIGKGADR